MTLSTFNNITIDTAFNYESSIEELPLRINNCQIGFVNAIVFFGRDNDEFYVYEIEVDSFIIPGLNDADCLILKIGNKDQSMLFDALADEALKHCVDELEDAYRETV